MEGRYYKVSIGWPYYTGLYKIMYIIIINVMEGRYYKVSIG